MIINEYINDYTLPTGSVTNTIPYDKDFTWNEFAAYEFREFISTTESLYICAVHGSDNSKKFKGISQASPPHVCSMHSVEDYCSVFTFAFKKIEDKKYVFVLVIPGDSHCWETSPKQINDQLQIGVKEISFNFYLHTFQGKSDKYNHKIQVNQFILNDNDRSDLGQFIQDYWNSNQIDSFVDENKVECTGYTLTNYTLKSENFAKQYIKKTTSEEFKITIKTPTSSTKPFFIILIIVICFIVLFFYLFVDMNEINVI